MLCLPISKKQHATPRCSFESRDSTSRRMSLRGAYLQGLGTYLGGFETSPELRSYVLFPILARCLQSFNPSNTLDLEHDRRIATL